MAAIVGVKAFKGESVKKFIDDNYTSGDRIALANAPGGAVMIVIYPSS